MRIELATVRPTVWRCVDVPLSCKLAALHEIIQISMGWTDIHLHEFVIGDRTYGVPERDDLAPADSRVYRTSSIHLRSVIDRGIERFVYVYDFGVEWRHNVIVEEIRQGEADIDYPRFVGGAWRCPPEDCRFSPT